MIVWLMDYYLKYAVVEGTPRDLIIGCSSTY